MVDISIVDGIINQLITGGYHIVYIYIIIYILIINHIESYRYRFDIICVYIYIYYTKLEYPPQILNPPTRAEHQATKHLASHSASYSVCNLAVSICMFGGQISMFIPYAPWCWNIFIPTFARTSKITQSCRCAYTSTMVRICSCFAASILLIIGVVSVFFEIPLTH